MLGLKDKLQIKTVYTMSETESERIEAIKILAETYNVSTMDIRQILQEYGAYGKKEGKTVKEQYAAALYAVTNIPAKEWMKLRLESQQKLMGIFRNG